MGNALEQFMGVHQPIEHHHHYEVKSEIPEIVPAVLFEKLFGVTVSAIRGKIDNEHWVEGQEFCYDPQGKIHVIVEGYYAWVKSGKSKRKQRSKVCGSDPVVSSSTSGGTVTDIEKSRAAHQRKKGSKPQPVFDQKL